MNATVVEQFLEMGRQMAYSMAPRGKEGEYVSAAYLGIVWAVQNAERRMYDTNLERWVRACIYRFLHKHRLSDHLIRIPAETRRLAKLQGKKLEPLKREELCDIAYSPSQESEVLELLLKSAEVTGVPEDKAIITMRIEGYHDPEIARKLSKSVSYIQKRRISIKIQFEKLNRE